MAVADKGVDRSEPMVERVFISSFEGMRDGSRVEIRSAPGATSSRTIGGYAAVFGVESRNMGGFQECVMPVFFNKSRSENWPDVICRYNHQDMYLLGTTRSGSLRVQTDNRGLLYDVDIPESRNDVLEVVGRGDIVHSSFSFITYEDQWRYSNEGVPLRQLVSGKLLDVSPVLQPAYPDATVGLRSLALAKEASLEDVLALSEQNELRKLFVRTDVAPAVAPVVDPIPDAAPVVAPVAPAEPAQAAVVAEPAEPVAPVEPVTAAQPPEAPAAEPAAPVEPAAVEPAAQTPLEPVVPRLFGPLEKMKMAAKKPEPIEG